MDKKKLHIPPYYVCVSKDTIITRLCACCCQNNLFELLVFGKEHAKYQEWLRNVSYRFQYISSFVYKSKIKIGNEIIYYVAKLPEEFYSEQLFDQFCEVIGGGCTPVEEILDSEDDAEMYSMEKTDIVFEKYQAVKKYILPMVQNTNEQLYPSYFRDVIEYVVEHDTYPDIDDNIDYKFPNFPALTAPDFEYRFTNY